MSISSKLSFKYLALSSSLAEKYPQIKDLFGVDPTFKWKVIALTLIQFGMLQIIKDQSWFITVLVAYCFGGVINHALMLGNENRATLNCYHKSYGS